MKAFLYFLSTGLLLALAWPTYGFSPLIFVAFVPLLLIGEKKIKEGKTGFPFFMSVYFSFLIWNFIATYWLYYSTAFGMLFAVLVNSLLMTLVFYIYSKIYTKLNFLASSSFFICLWLSFEQLHFIWDFSWPWLSLGHVFSETTSLIQWYEYSGVFGGSLWILIVNFTIFKSLLLFTKYKDRSILYRLALRLVLFIGLPIFASVLIKPDLKASSHLETIALQPNIDPYADKYALTDADIKDLLLELSEPYIKPGEKQLFLAPETVFASGTQWSGFEVSQASYFGNQILKRNPQAEVLYGISAYDLIHKESNKTLQSNFLKEDLWYNDFNSAVFQSANSPAEFYHKSKLVVGVENFPYKGILQPLMGDIMIDLGGTVATKTTQENRDVFNVEESEAVAPIICYESVYGEYVTDYVKNGATLLTIITNDAWWGNTQGHQQHWSYAKLRAIETRRAVARSANTGISGFIDRDGSVISKTKYDEKTAISANVPLYDEITFYVKYGNIIPRVAQFLALFIFLFAVTRRRG